MINDIKSLKLLSPIHIKLCWPHFDLFHPFFDVHA